ncbi:methionine aminopeptidase type I [Williamsia limnetica]|uniref:Methionine aminopeptidase n=1 Tax=Williamsia limnetica TaxID=882452 RepID=A0A318RDD3_WILLI|nr:type I methionyl aminopeptidase [Williamsia limnetica]PYE11883.1 methionine aminopeptidase type I [Williamsia limnetica]
MVDLKTPGEIEMMREAGRVVARALAAVKSAAVIGSTLKQLDDVAAAVISDAGAKPVFLDYHPNWAPTPFAGVICASVNDAVVHGIPDERQIGDGDLVSIDCGALLDGWCGDAAISFVVGEADQADLDLIAATDAALMRGIEAAQPGAKMGDIGHAIAGPARIAGYGLLEDHGGHGIGRTMHEAPHVPNEGRARRGLKLKPGLVIAIEPMLIRGGTDQYVHAPDGWELRSASGARAAHSEHTVAITESGPQILTTL